MCGIVGAVARHDVVPTLLEGLFRLEYRGYDSSGIAVRLDSPARIERVRLAGKVEALRQAVQAAKLSAHTGIAHTRWATHGAPSADNAHPHLSNDQIVLVHNGIIENHESLRTKLLEEGYKIQSQTDSELIAHTIHRYFKLSGDFLQSVFATVKELRGAYALAIMHRDEPSRVIAVRAGAPLVLGIGDDGFYVASDPTALSSVSSQFIYLEEHDCADLSLEGFSVYDRSERPVERAVHVVQGLCDHHDKAGFRHFMLKEIHEQPQAVMATLEGRLGDATVLVNSFGDHAEAVFAQVKRVQMVACGTSYHAGLIAKSWLEQYAGVKCSVEIASEFRYRRHVVEDHTLFVSISQSGETADTLAALQKAKTESYMACLAICNVAHSSLVRESNMVLLTRAGMETGVASTKAFTTQLVSLLLLTLALMQRDVDKEKEVRDMVEALRVLPHQLQQVLSLEPSMHTWAQHFIEVRHMLFLGRGTTWPVAREGALKIKEIAYIYAEAYAAGELKHGPLALVDPDMPVVVLVPNNALLEKLLSNVHEVRTRGGQLFLLCEEGVRGVESFPKVVSLPRVHEATMPIVMTIPLQLLSYQVAVLKGTDVDQPRNLAKSVTVE